SLSVLLHFITFLILGLDSPNLGSSGLDHDRRLVLMIEFVDSLSECGNEVVYEGWMVRCGGRRKIGRSFIHIRHSVLQSRLLDYYKRNPEYNQ
ncbi:hypothetical protein TorRG33x02_345800, partial [Trema orientale]